MRATLGVIAGLGFGFAMACAPAWGGTIYSGPDAAAIYARLAGGQGFCVTTRQVVVPGSNPPVVEQEWCQCVSSLDGSTADTSGRITAVVVSFGPEQQCTLPPTAQQRTNALAQIADIDNRLLIWDNFLQHIWDGADRYAYANDPNYKAQYDAYVQEWANYGRWAIQQLQAARQGDVNIATSVAAPPTAPPAPGGAGAPAAPVIGPGAAPVNPAAPQAPAGGGAGPGLLGVPMAPN